MNFKQLIWQVKFDDVKKALMKNYPDQEDSAESYKHVFYKLLMKPIEKFEPEELTILTVSLVKGFDDELYWDVSGIKPNSEDPKQHWALEYCTWSEWLGFEIQESQLENLSKEEYVAHCLWEMTFIDFNEQSIKETKGMLTDIVDQIKEGQFETISWEEFKKSLQDEDDEE